MKMRKILVCLLLAGTYTWIGQAQSEPEISVSKGNITAGESLEVKLTFDKPAPCSSQVQVVFRKKNPPRGFGVGGRIEAGQTAATLKEVLPKDFPAGDYVSEDGTLQCDGYSEGRTFPVPARTITVKGLPDANQYPTTAELSLSLTQKQFLDTKIAQLETLKSQLSTRLEGHSANLPALREFLAQTVTSADEALTVTETQYREQIMKPQDKAPDFFADFHAQYKALLIDLKATTLGVSNTGAKPNATLMYVQLKKRNPSEQLSNTLPPAATAVWQLIKDNISAYKFIKSTGRITFSTRIASFPAGARISYKKLTDDEFRDYSSPTDVPNATFELATWIFKFHKEECTDEPVLRINPYEDNSPEISAEFMHCRGK